MSETTEACIRGCSMYRRHLDDCDGHAPSGRPCRGCLPRRATHGHLCDTCHRRFELMITDAPTVIRWLTGNMTSGDGAARAKEDHEAIHGGGDGSPTPIKVDVLDLRDLLRDRLTLWVDDWCEHKGLTGPESHSPDIDSAYLLTWLPGLVKLDWIGDWWDEMAETMSEAHALAPWRPVMRRVPGIPCPDADCGETNLAIFGGEEDITCLSCRTIIRAEHFALWERIVQEDREQNA